MARNHSVRTPLDAGSAGARAEAPTEGITPDTELVPGGDDDTAGRPWGVTEREAGDEDRAADAAGRDEY